MDGEDEQDGEATDLQINTDWGGEGKNCGLDLNLGLG
jgi:hypothetical protein